MADRLLTPSKITAWLDCAHYLTLRHEVDDGTLDQPPSLFGEMAQILLDKGIAHERNVMADYREAGREVFEVPDRDRDSGESFAAWTARVGAVLNDGHDVIYQMPFVHDGIRGIADFLERVEYDDGTVTYEPVDAKLARAEAKPAHVLQLSFYSEAIAHELGRSPEHLHIALGSGRRETVRVAEVLPYWRRLRSRLSDLIAEPPAGPTHPEPCDHCAFCEFAPVCDKQWRAEDSLIYVAGIRKADRELLAADGVDTLAALSELNHAVPELPTIRQDRLSDQAALQVRARLSPEEPPPFELISPATAPEEGSATPADTTLTGFAALPEPDDGDIFLDYEGHPFWRADVGLFFLFGWLELDEGEWRYKTIWAHNPAEEADAAAQLIDYLASRRLAHPGMHVYHYNHTERTALQRLAVDNGIKELELENLIGTGLFVDLYPAVTGAVQAGVESYGLKHIERLTGYERSHDIDRGAGAVVEYERWMGDGEGSRLDRIARYNEDDVRATRAVRDWLIEQRPIDIEWRDGELEPTVDEELDARIEALHRYGPGTPEHLMGDLLGYWRREDRVTAAEVLVQATLPEQDQLVSPTVIAGLRLQGIRDRFHARTGKPLSAPFVDLAFPPQELDPDIQRGKKLVFAAEQHRWGFYSISDIDRANGTLTVIPSEEASTSPNYLVLFEKYDAEPKLTALSDLADQLLEGSGTAAAHALLRRDRTVLRDGAGPADGRFVGGYRQLCEWIPHLSTSYLPVQGPPGTGKTFTGAHVIHTLVAEHGMRVGITAMSHQAIDNLMEAVVNRFAAEGTPLKAVRKGTKQRVTGVRYSNDNKKCASADFDVVGGTAWLFANQQMRGNPVDVLVVDEAGQLGLADTLAATISAKNVLLLGDPQQLPQVSQASHPNGSGASALEHLLGPGAETFPPERGMLLDTTWRMHPDVCGFISEVMYEGRLVSEAGCATQNTGLGTGLRWMRAEHAGRSTESPEEAELVLRTARELLDESWTDRDGETRPITTDDIIVVTPYNDQRRLLETVLAADPETDGIEVGTVDSFQGREAVAVIFSMATSSAEFLPRDVAFLFSRNRLNVAISRARCLAYLICSEDLLDTRPGSVEQLVLISALCAFVERADAVAPPEPS